MDGATYAGIKFRGNGRSYICRNKIPGKWTKLNYRNNDIRYIEISKERKLPHSAGERGSRGSAKLGGYGREVT